LSKNDLIHDANCVSNQLMCLEATNHVLENHFNMLNMVGSQVPIGWGFKY